MNIDPKELAERLINSLKDFVTSDEDFEKYEKEMLEHMRKKYGIELQVDWSDRTVYENNYDSWNCSIKGTTDESEKGKIVVIRWRKKKDYPYEDNYYPNVIVGEIENRVHKSLDGQIGEYKMYVTPEDHIVDNKFSKIEQLEDYLKEKGNKIGEYYVTVMLPDIFKNEKIYLEQEKCIFEKLKNANIGNCYCVLCWIDSDIYFNLTMEELPNIFDKKIKIKRISKTIF